MSKILESGFESVFIAQLAEMGFSCHGGDAFDPDASSKREGCHGALLPKLLCGEVSVPGAEERIAVASARS